MKPRVIQGEFQIYLRYNEIYILKLNKWKKIVKPKSLNNELDTNLIQDNTFFKLLVEENDDFIIYIDHKGIIKYVNPSTLNHLLYTQEELHKTSIFDLVHPEELQSITFTFNKYITKNPAHEISVRLRKKNHNYITIVIRANRHFTSSGKLDGIILTGRRPSRIENVAESGSNLYIFPSIENLQRILVNIPCVIWSCDSQLHTNYVSTQSFEILGFEVEEILENPDFWAQRIHPKDYPKVLTKWKELFSKNIPYEMEYRFIKKNGEQIWIYDKSFHFYKREGEWFADGFLMDVSESKVYQRQLSQSQKMEALGRFAGGIAHDFNNFISIIQGYAELINLDSNSLEEIQTYSKQIQETTQKASNLTKKILLFSRSQVPDSKPIALNDLIRNSQNLLKMMVGESMSINFELSILNQYIYADENQIEQILLNLIANAKDAMDAKGTIQIKTFSSTYMKNHTFNNIFISAGKYCSLSITDSGKGIEENEIHHLFEPFYSTKELGRGTGLGLSIVYGIVSQLGGAIQVKSEINVGTTIQIDFPLYNGDVPEFKEKYHSSEIKGKLIGKKILLVEDNPQVQEMIFKFLSKENCRLTISADGKEALTCVNSASEPFDLIITDIKMPNMDGIELTESILLRNSEQKILLISGYSDQKIAEGFLSCPNKAFLQKPFKLEDLKHTIMALIREK